MGWSVISPNLKTKTDLYISLVKMACFFNTDPYPFGAYTPPIYYIITKGGRVSDIAYVWWHRREGWHRTAVGETSLPQNKRSQKNSSYYLAKRNKISTMKRNIIGLNVKLSMLMLSKTIIILFHVLEKIL